MEEKLETTKFKLKKKFGICYKLYDFAYTPVVQSGGVYDLKPNSESNNELLTDNVVLLSLASKYCEMNCHVQRTLLINPTDSVGKNYQAVHYLHKEVINALRPGQKLFQVHDH